MGITKKMAIGYMLPGYVIIIFIFAYPIIILFRDAFFNRVDNILTFVGLQNFKGLLADPIFYISLRNNFIFLIIVPIIVIISLVIAVLLYEGLFGWKVYRVIIFLPYILAIPVVSIIFIYTLAGNGPINDILINKLGIISKPILFFSSTKIAIWTLIGVIIWKEIGLGIVLFLARLMTVDEQLFEAAEIDGANWFHKFIHITIPQLKTIIEFYTLFTIITVFCWVFNYVFSSTNGGPGNSTYILELYIYKIAFRYNIPNVASCAAILLLVFVSFIIFIQFRVQRRFGVD